MNIDILPPDPLPYMGCRNTKFGDSTEACKAICSAQCD